jgi:hypothetical protein
MVQASAQAAKDEKFVIALFDPAFHADHRIRVVLFRRDADDTAFHQSGTCKIVFDITLIAIGIFLGGSFGIGTIVLGFVMGPTIQYFRKNIEKRVGK